MPRKELLPLRSSLLRTATNFLKELPRNKDGEDLPRGTSLKQGGKGWRSRKFVKERRGRMKVPCIEDLPRNKDGNRGTSLRKGGTRYISKVATDLPCWPFYLRKFIFNCIIYFVIVLIQYRYIRYLAGCGSNLRNIFYSL